MQRPHKAYPVELAQFHSTDYVEFLHRISPNTQNLFADELARCMDRKRFICLFAYSTQWMYLMFLILARVLVFSCLLLPVTWIVGFLVCWFLRIKVYKLVVLLTTQSLWDNWLVNQLYQHDIRATDRVQSLIPFLMARALDIAVSKSTLTIDKLQHCGTSLFFTLSSSLNYVCSNYCGQLCIFTIL